MSWVEEASVIYDQQETRGLRSTTLATATVSVLPKAGERIDTQRKGDLQAYVAGAFVSMRPEQVVITNLNGDDIASSSQVRPEDFKTKYLEEKARFEQYVRSLVQSQLSHITGVRVQIKAELDETLSTESIATKPEGQAVAVREIDSTDETEQVNSDGGARTGGFAQGPSRNPRATQVAERKNTTKTKVTTSDITTQAFTNRVITTTSGLVPKRMGASIQVPRDYVVGIWKKRKVAAGNKEPEKVDDEEVKLVQGEIMDQIKTAIEPLMTELTAGKDDFSQVKVGFYDTLPAPAFEKPSAASKALFWAERNGNTLAMLGLAAFSLVMLRSMVRSGGGGDSPAGAPAIQVHDPHAASEEEEEDRPRLRFKKAESVKDDLADMVREDPDAAAAILSNWISNAG